MVQSVQFVYSSGISSPLKPFPKLSCFGIRVLESPSDGYVPQQILFDLYHSSRMSKHICTKISPQGVQFVYADYSLIATNSFIRLSISVYACKKISPGAQKILNRRYLRNY